MQGLRGRTGQGYERKLAVYGRGHCPFLQGFGIRAVGFDGGLELMFFCRVLSILTRSTSSLLTPIAQTFQLYDSKTWEKELTIGT